MSYATRNRRPPRTLTDAETAKVLKVSGEHVSGFRDHLILSFALGCGLRQSEIVALNVEDVAKLDEAGKLVPRRMLQLKVFKGRERWKIDPETQRVPLPDGTYYKLQKYLTLVQHDAGPLFLSRKHQQRLSDRAVRSLFAKWQRAANVDHLYAFHHLRHTSISNVQRANRDVRVTQKFARHANINTTTIYEHASDEEVVRATKNITS